MSDLYLTSTHTLVILFSLSALLFAIQSVYVGILISDYHAQRISGVLGEGLLLFFIAALTLLSVTIFSNKRYGIASLDGADWAIYIIGFCTILYFIYLRIIKANSSVFIILTVSLSFGSFVPGIDFTYLYLAMILLMMYRAFVSALKSLHKQKNEISAFSVKEGLDTLPAGIMFCDVNGYIYLINTKMQDVLMRFTNKEHKNGAKLWQLLQEGQILEGDCQVIEGDLLIRTAHDAWRFSKRSFSDHFNTYFEIIATDVTQSMGIFYTLEEEGEKLINQRKEIEALNQKIEIIQREKEYLSIRSQVHDVLGQRLTAMQRMSQSSDFTDYHDFLLLIDDIRDQIKEKRSRDPGYLFDEISAYFKKIGLSIVLHDTLPVEEDIAFLFLSVLREASTNAIRHAGATEIHVHMIENNHHYRIEITNNGQPPTRGLVEGGGLFGMRSRVENAGGSLKVEVIPEFSLIITIGRGDKNDSSIHC